MDARANPGGAGPGYRPVGGCRSRRPGRGGGPGAEGRAHRGVRRPAGEAPHRPWARARGRAAGRLRATGRAPAPARRRAARRPQGCGGPAGTAPSARPPRRRPGRRGPQASTAPAPGPAPATHSSGASLADRCDEGHPTACRVISGHRMVNAARASTPVPDDVLRIGDSLNGKLAHHQEIYFVQQFVPCLGLICSGSAATWLGTVGLSPSPSAGWGPGVHAPQLVDTGPLFTRQRRR